MLKRQRATAPNFRVPVPFNPITGERARLGPKADLTRVAMMQVIEKDTHDNYVVCRGYDPEAEVFLNSVNVGKPFSLRGTNPYTVGQIFAATKPRTALGDTPGMAETTIGQPADLTEGVQILTDDAGNPIAWLDIETSAKASPPKFYNAYGGVVPACGVCAVSGVYDVGTEGSSLIVPQCTRPSGTSRREYLINSDSEVAMFDASADPPATGVGNYQNDGEMVLAAYDAGTPAIDEIWIPKSGQFTLTKGYATSEWHVVVAGIYDNERKILMGRVVRKDGLSVKGFSTAENYYFVRSDGTKTPALTTDYYRATFLPAASNNTTTGELRTGVKTIRNATPAYGDPFAEMIVPGTWKINIRAWLNSVGALTWSYDTLSTSVTDGHSHTYNYPATYNPPYVCVTFVLEERNSSSSSWFQVGKTMQAYIRFAEDSANVSAVIVAVNSAAGAQLRLRTTMTSIASSASVYCYADVSMEYAGPYVPYSEMNY